ncbi:gfo/Idh/MocA family oxidoreductase [Rhodohalobacter sp. SW132]|uniref:Gfo/Idh/MocA family protein n=1 Tax=Rhodohalobacter sp. SW132 TaxID=2293433 RepID=UPI000E22883F|nr:Gfo/Idh/MocA family oxidoreductase [Rhodohalobacter sp. SW132]REL38517.1 gfo/Idh/MocA family oxidoreductase [Rhodohalobacter sp. SW132]
MSKNITRKSFLKHAGTALTIASVGFPSIIIPRKKEKIGVALVGLGSYAGGQLAPALQETEYCELRGIVTGTPSKIPEWQERYGIRDQNVYNYENLHEVANNDDIDVIYIVTPPGVHARDAIVAAEAGKHVWCEKPMAMDEEECQNIIDAASKNGVQLTIGYRMQHEPNTQTVIKFGREETYGVITGVQTGAGYSGAHRDPENWRRNPDLGGGALYDMGVYPINAARFATGMEPIAVKGRQWSDREEMYSDVDEHTDFEMEFPNGVIATGETSFGNSTNYLNVECTDGWYRLSPMQSYRGVQGETSDGRELPPAGINQQARQMDNDARAILDGKDPIVPGEDGLADIRIVKAIMESSQRGGEWIEL